jgi:anti-sigma regulatory factor (Ser/Thr protein kinase)
MRSSNMATGQTTLDPTSQDRGLRAMPEIGMVGSWPLQSYLELAAAPREVPAARRHTRLVLQAWGFHAASDDAELVVSELVSNSVAMSAAINQQVIRLWLVSDGQRVLVVVWDASPDSPEIANPAADAESGRGLLIVEALSARWGWFFAGEIGGKVVWASLPSRIDLRG